MDLNAPPRRPPDQARKARSVDRVKAVRGGREPRSRTSSRTTRASRRSSHLSDIVGKSHSLEECFSPGAIPAAAWRPRRARRRARALDRDRRAAAAWHHSRGAGRAARKGPAAPGRPTRVDADRRCGATAVSRRARSRRRRSRRARDAARRRRPRPFPGSSMACCAISRAARADIGATSDPFDLDTPAWLAARWRKTYGDELRAPSPPPIATSRRSI